MAEALHVANGHCTTRLIEAACYITELSFWEMVKGLASRSPALVSIDVTQPPETDRPLLPSGTLSLRQ